MRVRAIIHLGDLGPGVPWIVAQLIASACALHFEPDAELRRFVHETLRVHADIVSAESVDGAQRALANLVFDLAVVDLAQAGDAWLGLLKSLCDQGGHAITALVFSAAGAERAARPAGRDRGSPACWLSLGRIVGFVRSLAVAKHGAGLASQKRGRVINLHTLSVDDEPDIREIINLSLGLDPLFRVRECSSGRAALRDATEWRPDLILLDVMMPVMDGVTTLAELRADRRTAMIPVVFMTARAQAHEQARFKSLGAAGVIPKPFDPMRLPALVRDVRTRSTPCPAEDFLWRLNDAFAALTAAPSRGGRPVRASARRWCTIKDVAQMLAGTSRLYGFAGIGLEATALEDAVDGETAGRTIPMRIEHALDRLLARIATS